jgi:hypothetical protein
MGGANRPVRLPVMFIFLLLPATSGLCGESDSVPGSPPGDYRILAEDSVVKIPFEVFKGDILIAGELNGKEVRMLVDNGFLWDQLLFFGSPAVDSLGLQHDGKIEVGGGGQGDPVESNTASEITISFPGVEFSGQTAVITPYTSGISDMWSGTHGQVSATLFKHFVVDIDFDRNLITLAEPEKFQYDGNGVEIPLNPLLPGAWSVPATLKLSDGRKLSLDLMMDLGDSNPLFVVTGMSHDIEVPDQAIRASLGFGIQGEIRGHYGRVRSVEIGGYQVEDVLAGFVSKDYGGRVFHEATIGFGLLSRFNIVFDYPSQRMFVEPNKSSRDAFEYNMSGMSLRKGRGGFLEIVQIVPDSPASEAGLQAGDRVIRINGEPAIEYDYWKLVPILQQEGATVDLVLLRDDSEEEVSLILRRLI